MRFIRISARCLPWRKPCAERRPSRALSRSDSLPSTLTNTRAARRSGEVSTSVTVTKPIRGSFSSVGDRGSEDLANHLVDAPHSGGWHPLADVNRHVNGHARPPPRVNLSADVAEAEQVALERAAVRAAALDEALHAVGPVPDLASRRRGRRRASSAATCRGPRSRRPRRRSGCRTWSFRDLTSLRLPFRSWTRRNGGGPRPRRRTRHIRLLQGLLDLLRPRKNSSTSPSLTSAKPSSTMPHSIPPRPRRRRP